MTKSWEREKDRMYELYMVRGMKLTDLQRIMSEQYGFDASERSYKQKFKAWQWFKKTPRGESYAASGEEYSSNEADYGYGERSARRPHPSSLEVPTTYATYADPLAYDSAVYPGHAIATTAPGPVSGYASCSSWDAVQAAPMAAPVPNPHWSQSRSQFKQCLRNAERGVDHGEYDHAERALGEAMRQLQWMRDTIAG